MIKPKKPSRLELYLEILQSLEAVRSTKLAVIQEKTNVEQDFLDHAMSFLEKQSLIQKEDVDNEIFYSTTPRGDRVTRYFVGLSQQVPTGEFGFV